MYVYVRIVPIALVVQLSKVAAAEMGRAGTFQPAPRNLMFPQAQTLGLSFPFASHP